MQLLDNYLDLKKQIYDYFGFEENWTVYPIDDCREYFWKITNTEVLFYDSMEAYESEDGMHSYSHELLISVQYPKQVYTGAEFTLILVDTHTDGNKFLAIFDNSKQIL